ncbi:hypothetical protein Curi_c22010 [Gottschalkia acidurici 9a]|uniref:Uncharacterized protein n=1 Tax=Gottschalkia acidurici (strain ATCC 7906 / DSM 604 / BCRC 14475 / CIP 104303 / KCTC 5404 / NCIMB 10678 / 9a) TaxID=1128398 RepID=K0B113_GOTA9|nr:hypothetical protein [Gottschalkia acidurici]AFS79204.1 hypothetical protein Curi_c22010 [Gottschalkia acidurici 9a]
MDDLSNSTNRDIKLTRNLEGARVAIRNVDIGLKQMSTETERTRNAQERMNNILGSGSKDTDSLTRNIKSLVGNYTGLQTALITLFLYKKSKVNYSRVLLCNKIIVWLYIFVVIWN